MELLGEFHGAVQVGFGAEGVSVDDLGLDEAAAVAALGGGEAQVFDGEAGGLGEGEAVGGVGPGDFAGLPSPDAFLVAVQAVFDAGGSGVDARCEFGAGELGFVAPGTQLNVWDGVCHLRAILPFGGSRGAKKGTGLGVPR
ncbi:hypothetical protein [Sphaerisporangium corydalis]|uniref:Uncharacterized protein n=1 Tax=Sphaerisporangium corydalis TaxID=1441875 RepID=A0ABV9EHD4_9ACTN|nr:hypothetical protein [Sphaerisporangium corydalis]